MTRRVFDPRLAISFSRVVEAGSITAGANVSGVTQPWMSEQIRKLEQQLGSQLLVRTSRRLSLTRAGQDFLPHADALAAANRAAQDFAGELLDQRDDRLRIGACLYSAGLPQRHHLIQQLVRDQPTLAVDVRQARSTDLIDLLIEGTFDLVIVHQLGITDHPGIEHTPLLHRHGFLMMDETDQLASLAEVPLAALAGRRLMVAPGNDDPRSMNRSLKPLVDAGMVLVTSPDNDRQFIEQMARQQGMMCLSWHFSDDPAARAPVAGRVFRRIAGAQLRSPIALVRRAHELHSRPVRRAWDIAQTLAMAP